MLLAPNVAAHSYYDSVYLKIFTALSFLANLRLLTFANEIVHLRIFFLFNVVHGFGRDVVWPWTVPNLGMADQEFELWTGSDMGSSDLEFELETGPVRGLADPELAYCSRLGLDPNWQIQSSN